MANVKLPQHRRTRHAQTLLTTEEYLAMMEHIQSGQSVSDWLRELILEKLYPNDDRPSRIPDRSVNPCLSCGGLHSLGEIRVSAEARHSGLTVAVRDVHYENGRLSAVVEELISRISRRVDPCRLQY